MLVMLISLCCALVRPSPTVIRPPSPWPSNARIEPRSCRRRGLVPSPLPRQRGIVLTGRLRPVQTAPRHGRDVRKGRGSTGHTAGPPLLISANTGGMQPSSGDLPAMLTEVVQVLASKLQPRKHTLQRPVGEGGPWITGGGRRPP
jgi:hypothetical protein